MRKLTETHFVSLRRELLSCNRNEFILLYAIIAVQLLITGAEHQWLSPEWAE